MRCETGIETGIETGSAHYIRNGLEQAPLWHGSLIVVPGSLWRFESLMERPLMMVFDWNPDLVRAAKKPVINAAGRIMCGQNRCYVNFECVASQIAI